MSMQLVIFDETHLCHRSGFRAWQIAAIAAAMKHHTGKEPSAVILPNDVRISIETDSSGIEKIIKAMEREIVIQDRPEVARVYLTQQRSTSKNKRARRESRGW